MPDDQTEVERAMEQTRARLEALSVRLEGNESPVELVSILETVERYLDRIAIATHRVRAHHAI